ncbi:unnamed protein product [Haemonchus placei]|uniref:Uncharacterized protein n=1 Tax=Haemonchus placei TaxID=6290 RepID=A0A0N4WFY3_HAEPC|nr:unnamed protein product [Haemonchus placei]
MNGVELAFLATCAIVLLAFSNASPVNDQSKSLFWQNLEKFGSFRPRKGMWE